MTPIAALRLIYATHAVDVTIGGVPARAVPDGGSVDAGGFAVAGVEESIRVIAEDHPTLTRSTAVILNGITYRARALEPLPPDQLETRVRLERQ